MSLGAATNATATSFIIALEDSSLGLAALCKFDQMWMSGCHLPPDTALLHASFCMPSHGTHVYATTPLIDPTTALLRHAMILAAALFREDQTWN